MTESPADLLLEWCSLRGTGTRAAFVSAFESLFQGQLKATQLMSTLERLGHLEVDWHGSGRWWVTPPVLNLIGGAGGHACLVGARTRVLLDIAHQAVADGRASCVQRVDQGDAAPAAVYIGVDSLDAFQDVAATLGAQPLIDIRQSYKEALPDLDDILTVSIKEFTWSGIGAQRFDADSMRFVPCEIRRDRWTPGCFRQQAHGVHRFLFVDDDLTRYQLDRWVAIHAELRRVRRTHPGTVNPLCWDSTTMRLAVDRRAQLPLPWARAAVLCTGLHPSHDGGSRYDIYEGIETTTYGALCKTLHLPPQRAPISRS
jgi:hypothetical protein